MTGEVSPPVIRQATAADVAAVAGILQEAALWLDRTGKSLWDVNDFRADLVAREIDAFYLAEIDGEAAGTLKFQLEDPLFWPDLTTNTSAFVHQLAVRRVFAGGHLSTALLKWAVEHSRSLGKAFLRLDCDATRPRLRTVYEQFGFRNHSIRQVGSFLAARYEVAL